MARCIDADELLKKLPDDLPYKASVKRVLIQAPEADVVPKSEVERLEQEIKALVAFKDYFSDLYGHGLEVANWHENGTLEPFDNFYESAEDEYEAELKKKYTAE